MYGHNDAMPDAERSGTHPAKPWIRRELQELHAADHRRCSSRGQVPLLAKTPAVLPLNGPEDTAVQEYNMVVDELRVPNAIPVVPPDFHTYFKARTATHYWNATEPNGVGYQSMGQLWLQAILGAP